MQESTMRLDKYLVDAGYFGTRARAEDAIKRATIEVAGKIVTKAGSLVNPRLIKDNIKIQDEAQFYVSRSALKLSYALDYFKLDVSNRLALDLGASTGGFTQVLLERGAQNVIALDVGHSQLAPCLRSDARVSVLEGVNARYLTAEQLGYKKFNLLVCDVSFISLRLALPPSLALAEIGCLAMILIKPQFEAGKQALGRSGVIKNIALGQKIAEELGLWFENVPGWTMRGFCASTLKGRDGNQEYILFGEKSRELI